MADFIFEDRRSDKFSLHVREAQAKFDYYLLGFVGVLLAYISQNFDAAIVGFNSGTLQLFALLLLVSSAVAGFIRIQKTIAAASYTARALQDLEEIGQATVTFVGKDMTHDNGTVMKASDFPIYIEDMRARAASYNLIAHNHNNAGNLAGVFRNGLLLAGFLCLLGARVWAAY